MLEVWQKHALSSVYSNGLHPHLSSASSLWWPPGSWEVGHLNHFCYFPPNSETTPRMASFCPICLEQNWLTMAPEGVDSACLGFLLVLSSSGPAGNAFGGSLLVGLSGTCFHFSWLQPSSSRPPEPNPSYSASSGPFDPSASSGQSK